MYIFYIQIEYIANVLLVIASFKKAMIIASFKKAMIKFSAASKTLELLSFVSIICYSKFNLLVVKENFCVLVFLLI